LKKLVKYIILFFNAIAIAALLISYLTKWVSPVVSVFPSYLALGFPVILIINILFILFWIFMARKVFLYSTLAILLGWGILNTYFGFIPEKDNINIPEKSLNIMSYNVRLFSIIPWFNSDPQLNEITSFVNDKNPDIISFQEFSSEKKGDFSERKINQQLKKYKYHHIHYIDSKKRNYGLALYSKHRIIGTGIIHFSNSLNGCIYADIKIDTDTFRLYNIHLQSVRFDKKEHNFLENISETKDDQRIKGIKLVAERLQKAYIKRAQQAEEIKLHIQNSPFKVIVCGDFNATPSSYAFNCLKRNFLDSFREAGKGIGATYEKGFPWLRIDYILSDRYFYIQKHQTFSDFHSSDHFPIMATIKY